MELDEAIQHAREVVEESREYIVDDCDLEPFEAYCNSQCIKCAEEHEQLAEWLEELKDYRRFNGAKTFDNGFKQGEKYGYKKAIDDFADKIAIYGTYDKCGNVIDILKIAEELKKECAE